MQLINIPINFSDSLKDAAVLYAFALPFCFYMRVRVCGYSRKIIYFMEKKNQTN